MQEDIENRTLTLIVSGTKFTGRLLKAALSKYLAYCKERKQQKAGIRRYTPRGNRPSNSWSGKTRVFQHRGG